MIYILCLTLFSLNSIYAQGNLVRVASQGVLVGVKGASVAVDAAKIAQTTGKLTTEAAQMASTSKLVGAQVGNSFGNKVGMATGMVMAGGIAGSSAMSAIMSKQANELQKAATVAQGKVTNSQRGYFDAKTKLTQFQTDQVTGKKLGTTAAEAAASTGKTDVKPTTVVKPATPKTDTAAKPAAGVSTKPSTKPATKTSTSKTSTSKTSSEKK